MSRTIPRVVFAGTQSNSGKTTITCGILQILKKYGYEMEAFKCGPDYIDPMFHKTVLEIEESNLDLFLFEPEMASYLVQKHAENKDLAVIEGVMGYYDGIGESGTNSSTYEVARTLKAPTILIIPCQGMSTSALATLKGFIQYKPDSNIRGVIFNHMYASTYEQIKEIWEKEEGSSKVRFLGHVPQIPKELRFESRHLGLVPAEEVADVKDQLERLASRLEETVDWKGILEIAGEAEELEEIENALDRIIGEGNQKKARVGIAKDRAFNFYYRDNLELLESLGIELVEFSPIADRCLPEGISGLIFGGGYPEINKEALSENQEIRQEIRQALEKGIPCIAECGGFMYLNESIEGSPMVGYLKGSCSNQNRLVQFGYKTLTSKEDTMLCRKGEKLRGHEFHYYDCTENGDCFIAERIGGAVQECVVANERLYAGYPHIHFYSNPEAAKRFKEACLAWMEKSEQ